MNAIIAMPETDVVPIVMDGEEHYEIINGNRVELAPMGAYQSTLASFLGLILGSFARTANLGRVVVETLFQFDPNGKLQRRPDLAFVSYKRWPKNRRVPNTNAWAVIPELAIEVVSPSNTAEEIIQKIQDYFQSGVLYVWVIYPASEKIYIYSSPEKNVILTKKDYLDCETILPGLRFPVAELFDDSTEDSPSPNGAAPPS